eukprot:COSAG04_NODE_25536_length_306_cov_0.743961_1_plen_75_part_10
MLATIADLARRCPASDTGADPHGASLTPVSDIHCLGGGTSSGSWAAIVSNTNLSPLLLATACAATLACQHTEPAL